MLETQQAIAPVMPEIDFGADPLPDLYARLRTLRDQGHRVAPVRFNGMIAWAILRFDDLSAASLDSEKLPASPAFERSLTPVTGPVMQAMEGEDHRVNRLLISNTFLPHGIRKRIGTLLQPVANQLVDAFGASRELDIVSAFTQPYPFNVISRMLDVPPDRADKLPELLYRMFRYLWEPEQAVEARVQFDAVINPLIDARREAPGNDLISELTKAELNGRGLEDEEVRAFVRVLYPAGAETTFLTMGSMIWAVLSDPELKARLVEQPDLRPAAVEEALRLYGSIAMNARYTEREVEIGGVRVPADSWLLYGLASANYDERQFDDPERFSLDRFPKLRAMPDHLGFGRGEHVCLGLHLARAELITALSVLLDRLPGLRLADPEAAGPTGAIMRGVRTLQVCFDDVLPAAEVRQAI